MRASGAAWPKRQGARSPILPVSLSLLFLSHSLFFWFPHAAHFAFVSFVVFLITIIYVKFRIPEDYDAYNVLLAACQTAFRRSSQTSPSTTRWRGPYISKFECIDAANTKRTDNLPKENKVTARTHGTQSPELRCTLVCSKMCTVELLPTTFLYTRNCLEK